MIEMSYLRSFHDIDLFQLPHASISKYKLPCKQYIQVQTSSLQISLYFFSVYVVEAVSVEISGENVYSISYEDMQYFMFIEDKEATISCTVKGTDTAPNTAFLKVTSLTLNLNSCPFFVLSINNFLNNFVTFRPPTCSFMSHVLLFKHCAYSQEGVPLDRVLPESLYRIERVSSGDTHILKLKIDSSKSFLRSALFYDSL